MSTRPALIPTRGLVAAALCVVLSGACASVPPDSSTAYGSNNPYASVNRVLRGQVAIVELEGGEFVAPARHVVLSEKTTRWIGEDGPDSAPTEDVSRIIALRRPRAWGWGLLAALVGTAILIDEDLALDVALDVAVNLAFAYLDSDEGALPPEVGKIVYSAPPRAP